MTYINIYFNTITNFFNTILNKSKRIFRSTKKKANILYKYGEKCYICKIKNKDSC